MRSDEPLFRPWGLALVGCPLLHNLPASRHVGIVGLIPSGVGRAVFLCGLVCGLGQLRCRQRLRPGVLDVVGRRTATAGSLGPFPAGVIVVELPPPWCERGLDHHGAVGTGALVRLRVLGELLPAQLRPVPLAMLGTAVGVVDSTAGAWPRGVQSDCWFAAIRQAAGDRKLLESWALALHSNLLIPAGYTATPDLHSDRALPVSYTAALGLHSILTLTGGHAP